MKVLGLLLLLLIATFVNGKPSADLSNSEVADPDLLRELEMLEENLFGKELAPGSEEIRSSRQKRCMGYDIHCDERLRCCDNLECVETSGHWWYQKKYCRRKSG